MRRNIFLLLCLLSVINSYSQALKTGVLVVGATPAALAAAIQSAHSGVKTVLIDAGRFESITLSEADKSIKAGVYAEFIKHVDSLQKTSSFKNNQNLTPAFTAQVFKLWTDTIKNLTVLRNSAIKKIEKDGKGWEIDLAGRDIKADVLLDASKDYFAAKMSGLSINTQNIPAADSPVYSDKKYRTSVGILKNNKETFRPIPISSLLVPGIENLVLAGPVGETANLLSGQGAGTIAAYCAFFNTTTKNLKVRDIQTELLLYKSRLLKFEDINEADSAMIALQHIGATGILKGKELNGKLFFLPDTTVSTEELRQPFRELYSRSQIWFLDNKTDKLTLESALSLIKFVGSRGEELNKEVQKGWKTSLKLKGEFDLKRIITRREMAILLDKYLQPYTVAVDIEGNIKS